MGLHSMPLAPQRVSGIQTPFQSTSRSQHRVSRLLAVRTRAAQAVNLLSWEDVVKHSSAAPLNGFVKLPGSRPSTAPSRVLQTSPDSLWSAGIDDNHPVLLIRDTEAWCPYCERVWLALEYKSISYDTMFINLRDKPKWFLDLIPENPKGLVPVAKIRDRLVHESFDILKILEEGFPEPPLLAQDPAIREEVLTVCDSCETFANAGYTYMRGRSFGSSQEQPESSGQDSYQHAFEEQLKKLEQLIAKHGGPFLFGEELSLADVMYVPSLERFAAHMPLARGLDMRNDSRYPGLSNWYKAMDSLPSYQKVKSDDQTLQMLLKKFFGMEGQHVQALDEQTRAARLEAAAKMGLNHDRIITDVLNNCGILRVRTSQYGGTQLAVNGYALAPGPALVQAVDHALRRVCHQLITGTPGERPDCKEACAIGSAALVFFRSRASSPRDLTAAAAEELREACSKVLLDMY